MLTIILILNLFGVFTEPSYELAIGIQRIYNPPRKDYVVLIDYSKTIYEERLFVFDMNKRKIVRRSRVGHALKSGRIYPTKFSNVIESKLSSEGAFQTSYSYSGQYGYSMKLFGLDDEYNSNTFLRGIVFHPTISDSYMWTEGCFSLPKNVNSEIINLIKNGCLVYVYY